MHVRLNVDMCAVGTDMSKLKLYVICETGKVQRTCQFSPKSSNLCNINQ